jgi:hypothetical protein
MSDVAINIAERRVDRGVLAGRLVMYLIPEPFSGPRHPHRQCVYHGNEDRLLAEDRNYTPIRLDGRISPPTEPQDNSP